TACGTAPQNGDLGLMTSPKIIDPGKPANSILVQRPKRLDVSRMPPLATSLDNVQTVTERLKGPRGALGMSRGGSGNQNKNQTEDDFASSWRKTY
ncbi:MAG: hypothetical protein NC823_02450, partial [Candidatus Omnitrophica bacterium]|nr:hypothetical protein [Candidatus Omnitrophota bacterium]